MPSPRLERFPSRLNEGRHGAREAQAKEVGAILCLKGTTSHLQALRSSEAQVSDDFPLNGSPFRSLCRAQAGGMQEEESLAHKR